MYGMQDLQTERFSHLEWESPYGCPTNLKNIKTKYFEDFEDDDYDFYEDYAGIHSEKKITKKRKKKVFFLFKLLLLSGFAFCCFVGVQVSAQPYPFEVSEGDNSFVKFCRW